MIKRIVHLAFLAGIIFTPQTLASSLPYDEWRQKMLKQDLTWLGEVDEEQVQALTDYRSGRLFLIVAFAGYLGCQLPVVNKLLQTGLDANTELPRFGGTLASLVVAVKGEADLACMQSLIEYGLDVSLYFPHQRISLLNQAIVNEQTEIISVLCEKGVDPYFVDDTQMTAFDWLEITKMPKTSLQGCLSE